MTSHNTKIFGLSVIVGAVLVLAVAGYSFWTRPPQVDARNLTADILIAEQLHLGAIPSLNEQHFGTIIDLRPDGEDPNAPASSSVESVVKAHEMAFHYVPVPHGDIPDAAVTALSKALLDSPRPILLYCRSGRRAARTWSLAEASRPGGLIATDILAAVTLSGQSADDLLNDITLRISKRPAFPGDIR